MFRLNRWQVMGIALLVEATSGLYYAFGLYSNDLKDRFGFDQSQLSLIGTCGELGGSLGVHIGLLYDRFGPAATLSLGGLLGVAGWLPMWLAFYTTWTPSYGVFILASLLQGQSQMFADVSSVSTAGHNFPANRGVAMGLCKALVGLSGAILTQVYKGYFYPDFVSLLLYVTIFVAVVSTVGAIFMRIVPGGDANPSARQQIYAAGIFNRTLGLLVSLGILLLINALLVNFLSDELNGTPSSLISTSALAVFATAVIYLLTRRDSGEEEIPLLAGAKAEIRRGIQVPPPDVVPSFTYKEALGTLRFYAVAFCFMIGGGCSLLVINNMGQIVLSLGGSSQGQAVFVSLLSVCNCLGRMLSGYIGDRLCKNYHIPRPAVFVAATVMSAAGFFLLLVSDLSVLYISVILIGFSYGAFNALCSTLICELFGRKNFAAIYTTSVMGLALASYLFPTLLAASVYQAHTPEGSTTCIGRDCYFLSFLVCGCLVAVSVLVSLWLTYASRARYAELYPRYRYTASQ